MTGPLLYDLYSGAGGAARGYQQAGFCVIGVDIAAQPRYVGDSFVQMDALAFIAECLRGARPMPDAWHASPPCQFVSIMRNLPWLRGKEYPALIAPTRELLRATGKPWVIENVMGARWGSRQLAKHGLSEHGMQAGYLCGTMFGRRFYRHRLFETNWLWLAPLHPRHRVAIKPPRRDNRNFVWIDEVAPGPVMHPARKNLADLPPELGRKLFQDSKGSWRYQRPSRGLQVWQSAAARNGIPSGVCHTAGIAEARREMECEWMTRDELTQAIPPIYTRILGVQLMRLLAEARQS